MKELSKTRSRLPHSGIRQLMELSAAIPDAIHLEVGEPNANTPLHIREAATAAMNEGFTGYTSVYGFPSLRDALCEHLARRYGLTITSEQVLVTTGAVTALTACLQAIADADEEILIPDPGWPAYEMMALAQGSAARRYHLRMENGFAPDLEELERLVTPKTKAIFINTPGNPTGAVLTREQIMELLAFAVKHDLYVISDEVYDGIVFDGTHISPKAFDTDGRVISIFGASKNYAMTGWRIGYAVANPEITALMGKVLLPLISCASSISQKAAEASIRGPQDFVEEMRESYKQRRDKAYDLFTQANVKAFKPDGAFYMLVDMSELDRTADELALDLLKEEKVAVAPGTTFGELTSKMVRISLATEESQLLEGVRRICDFIARHKR
ncbi:pyridoxal phosphate-dependent aminotransferase [Brevibacillus sp. B_LB10_24]|uniref:pyridoxal phosphate-dependent aminotransferase n=1 Tax=Brevibacillus sp. B_LB10_24 TaxID=3380645 RepID=UPI0038BE12BC